MNVLLSQGRIILYFKVPRLSPLWSPAMLYESVSGFSWRVITIARKYRAHGMSYHARLYGMEVTVSN